MGKTTLARTLLRRDVGESLDQAHVTDISEAYTMVETEDGAELCLWDTPGFGDTARLLKRLKKADKPLGWFVGTVWDRFADRPLWCSQQAIKNVRDDADVVLYLVNATEDPGDAGYVEMEMEILGWTGKPVVVLLNQIGSPRGPVQEHREEDAWRTFLKRHPVVKEVVTLDAFARCWVQEDELLKLLGKHIPDDRQKTYTALVNEWQKNNLEVFDRSLDTLAVLVCAAATDGREVSKSTFLQKVGIGRDELNREIQKVRAEMSDDIAQRFEEATDRLLELHSLKGKAAKDIQDLAHDSFGMPEHVNESLWAALGGIAAGATGGLAADIVSGGLTVGGGTIIGGIGGGLGSLALAKGFNFAKGKGNQVRWSQSHFIEQFRRAILAYLAVAHFGRGRGEWKTGDPPEFWMQEVNDGLKANAVVIDALWKAGADDGVNQKTLHAEARRVIRNVSTTVLKRLYPDAELD